MQTLDLTNLLPHEKELLTLWRKAINSAEAGDLATAQELLDDANRVLGNAKDYSPSK